MTCTRHTCRPNLITLIGLFAVIASNLLVAYYAPNLSVEESKDVPRWVWLVCGFCLFFYSTLDNMDGKQARRTGNSSPLGLLFDHGCDAINAGLIAVLPFSVMLRTGVDAGAILGYYFIIIAPFYLATWEEFHVGALYLPVFNGPTEGILITVGAFLTSGIIGTEFWAEELMFGVSASICVVRFGVFGACITCVYQVINVCIDERKKGRSVTRALGRLYPFVALGIVMQSWVKLSPSVFQQHPRIFMLVGGFVFADSVAKLMLAHVCHQKYRPAWPVMALFALGPVNAVAQLGIPEVDLLLAQLVVAAGVFLYFGFHAVYELKTALGISVFTIDSSKAPKLK